MKKFIICSYMLLNCMLMGCSYSMDAIEGKITKRASFSLDADVKSSNEIVFSWDTSVSTVEDDYGNRQFAGFELYKTEDPENEYAQYEVISACYKLTSASYFQEKPELKAITTKDLTYTGNLPPGIYFFRIGVIYMESFSKDDKTYYYSTENSSYENHSYVAKISGQIMLEIK